MSFLAINTAWFQFVVLGKGSFFCYDNIIRINQNDSTISKKNFWKDRYFVI